VFHTVCRIARSSGANKTESVSAMGEAQSTRVGLTVFQGLYHQQQSWAPAGFCLILFSVFVPGGGQISRCKKMTTFLVVTLKTQVFTVTTNAQNTLQHYQGHLPSKHFIFWRGRLCSLKGRQSKPAVDGFTGSDQRQLNLFVNISSSWSAVLPSLRIDLGISSD